MCVGTIGHCIEPKLGFMKWYERTSTKCGSHWSSEACRQHSEIPFTLLYFLKDCKFRLTSLGHSKALQSSASSICRERCS